MANVSRPANVYTTTVDPPSTQKKKTEGKKSTKKSQPKKKPTKKATQIKEANRKKLLPWM